MALIDGLISGLHFNELSGTNCADFVGSYGGTASGATINTTTPKLGAANRVLDGIDDNINQGISPFYQESVTALSFVQWVYVDPADFNGAAKIIADSGSANVASTANDGFWFAAEDRAGTRAIKGIAVTLRTVGGSGRLYINSVDNVIPVAAWYLLGFTYVNGVGALYVNGVDVTGVIEVNPGTGDYIPRNANLYLGATNTNSLNLKCELDEPLEYNRAITASEMLQLWNGGAGLEVDAPIEFAGWPFFFDRGHY